MTNIVKESIREGIVTYCKAKGISYSEFAVKAGMSPATISNMKNGKWERIDDGLWQTVLQIVNPDNMSGLVKTGDFTTVYNVCEFAINNRFMVGLTADTGMGKTTALRAFAMRKNVFYVYIDTSVTPQNFIENLLRDLGISFYGSQYSKFNRVCQELNTLEQPLLIIDESGKLSAKMVLCLHSLRDKTKMNCGIVLAGMPKFKNELIRLRDAGRNGYSEFYRRINIWNELKGLQAEEISYILEINGITDKEVKREFRRLTRFGDLTNEILLYKTLNFSGHDK